MPKKTTCRAAVSLVALAMGLSVEAEQLPTTLPTATTSIKFIYQGYTGTVRTGTLESLSTSVIVLAPHPPINAPLPL